MLHCHNSWPYYGNGKCIKQKWQRRHFIIQLWNMPFIIFSWMCVCVWICWSCFLFFPSTLNVFRYIKDLWIKHDCWRFSVCTLKSGNLLFNFQHLSIAYVHHTVSNRSQYPLIGESQQLIRTSHCFDEIWFPSIELDYLATFPYESSSEWELTVCSYLLHTFQVNSFLEG